MFRLVLGKAGFGKSDYIRKKALESAKNGEKVLILVPDQMSFETERYMLYNSGEELYSKIKVYQFHSLCEDVFSKFGGVSEKRIDDNAKNLIMLLAIEACQDRLNVYKTDKKIGLIDPVLKIVDEFKSSGISTEDLFAISEKLSEGLAEKIREIALIYESYNAISQNSYIDPSEMENRAGEILRENNYFKDYILFIDGFESFDRPKISVLQSAFRDCKEIFASFCLDKLYSENENSFFSPVRKTAQKLVTLARKEGREVAKALVLDSQRRFKSDEMVFLEQNFCRNKNIKEKIVPENIKFFEAHDIHKELDFVCATIKKMVFEGKNYGDFTVICRNSKKYDHLIQSAFKKWEIPAFVSLPEMTGSSALMRLVLSVFNIIEYGFSTAELLGIAKTKLCGLSIEQISELENYLYLWNIDGKALTTSFTKSPFGFSDKEFADELAVLEGYRQRLVLPITNFKNKCFNSNGYKISRAVYDLLLEYDVPENLGEYCENLSQLGESEQSTRQERIWEKLMLILDEFAEIIGDSAIDLNHYGKLLKNVVAKDEMQDIPQRLDSVIFGSADNIKRESDVVFLIGCVQDEFPKTPDNNGMLNFFERRSLIENNIELENSLQDEILLERYYTYSSSCSAREKLFVSYHLSDGKNSFVSGELINRFSEIFEVKLGKSLPSEYYATSYNTLFSAFAKETDVKKSATYLKLLEENPLFCGKIEALERVKNLSNFSLEKEVAREMFSKNYLSPSQIELYHKCKFWYFCSYGLLTKERKTASVDVLQYGNLMHFVFEGIISQEGFLQFGEEEIITQVENLTQRYTQEKIGGEVNLSLQDKYRLLRMKETAIVIVKRIIEELLQSEFNPKFTEYNFAFDGEIKPLTIPIDGKNIIVGGIADRIDTLEKNGSTYARIIDYKTGDKSLKYSEMLNGLSLQMPIYLAALEQHGYKPAAAFYMHCAYPTIRGEKSYTEEKIGAEKDKLLCMKGVALESSEIIHAMERNASGKYIPIAVKTKETKDKKSGEISRSVSFSPDNNVLSEEEFTVLFKYSKAMIIAMMNNLANGEISATPLLKDGNPCDYCPYDCVCCIEKSECENIKISKEQAIEEMKRRLETDE